MEAAKRGWDSAKDVGGQWFEGGKGVFAQMGTGWERTKEQVEVPEWMRTMFEAKPESEGGSGGEGGGGGQKEAAAAAAATGAAFGIEGGDEERSGQQIARDDQMMMLTKKMIEIRTLLNTVGQSGALTLPSIVVIGSQSSGKSSVLEAIVGHEFFC